jgi:hypothetical protein
MRTNNPLVEKFENLFVNHLKRGLPPTKAYEEAEVEFQNEHKHRKHSSYNSFQTSRSRRIKKK